MNSEILLIFPNQLLSKHPLLDKNRLVILYECPRYFTDFRFHKKKLIFHRASMKAYQTELTNKNYMVEYYNFNDIKNLTALVSNLANRGIKKIHTLEILDKELSSELQVATETNKLEIITYNNPSFMTTRKWLREFFVEKKKYYLTSFYIAQRKRLKILLENGKPIGGKWSFDQENRKKIPKGFKIPEIKKFGKNKWVNEAANYVNKHFTSNIGNENDFFYPITSEEAKQWLDDFLNNRLQFFGDYEDAIIDSEVILFHSVLSPLLNSGLLTPNYIIKKILSFAKKTTIPINSLEAIIRQIIGWREFIRAIYLFEDEIQRNTNYWSFTKKIPKSFYDASTTLLPVDKTIEKVIKNAYCHHIERLMILGNFLLLCEIDPDEVYRWFMEMFIDAYDWVMVPNVYGMSQYADGGLMSTKPYISSSNYIRKMSNYKKGQWSDIFDSLFWSFIYHHKERLETNPRMIFMIKLLEKKDDDEINHLINKAKNFSEKLK